jgi:hypothetical protein
MCVLNPEGQFYNRDVTYDAGEPGARPHMCSGRTYRGGTWHFIGYPEAS